MEAAHVGWHAARLVRGEFEWRPADSPLLCTDQLPPFGAAAFEAAKAFTDSKGLLGSLGDRHFTVEFPWSPGAVSNVFARSDLQKELIEAGEFTEQELAIARGPTSLFQLIVADHSLYGKGIQSLLQIPVAIDEPWSTVLVNELNRWESSNVDLPPLFGSWCAGERSLAFVTFIPTQLCVPGLLLNLTVWACHRHERARQWMTSTSPGR
jgi:hypothetical protein